MKDKFNKLTLSVLLLFLIAILSSFIPEMFRDFFGDFLCDGAVWDGSKLQGCHYGDFNSHPPMWHWGWRHWLWAFMGLTLFVIQCFRIGKNFNKKEL